MWQAVSWRTTPVISASWRHFGREKAILPGNTCFILWPDRVSRSVAENHSLYRSVYLLLECGKCGFQTSVTAGTMFQDTRKPLALWFRMLTFNQEEREPIALGLQRGLGSYKIAWVWLYKLRRIMVRRAIRLM